MEPLSDRGKVVVLRKVVRPTRSVEQAELKDLSPRANPVGDVLGGLDIGGALLPAQLRDLRSQLVEVRIAEPEEAKAADPSLMKVRVADSVEQLADVHTSRPNGQHCNNGARSG